jgi:hypothetical protein
MDVIADRDALAVYTAVLTQAQGDVRESVLLQEETEAPPRCGAFLDEMSGEWAEVAASFRRENSRGRLLRAGLPLGIDYSVIPRATIVADDARLAAKAPRATSNAPRPGSIRYIALSAVGLNADKTKALVYVRFRTASISDALLMKELKDGVWVAGPRSCVGVA